VSFYVSTATFFLLHCDQWDRVVALPRHKFVTGATLLQLGVWSKVLGTCLCLERLTLYVFISVYSGFRRVVKSFGYMYVSWKVIYNSCALSKHIGNMCMRLRNGEKGKASGMWSKVNGINH